MLPKFHFKGKSLFAATSYFTFTLYIFYSIFLLFFSPYRQSAHSRFEDSGAAYNLVPFWTIRNYIKASDHINFNAWFSNLAGNVLVFMPLGFFLPLLFPKYFSFWRTLLLVITSTILVELLQFQLKVGSLDVDDIILNTIGGIMGFIVFKIAYLLFRFFYKRSC
jgi:glycopeptide antibiotics resistance protein